MFLYYVQLYSAASLHLTAIFQCLTKDYHTYPEKYRQWNCHFIVNKENETKRSEIEGISVRTFWL